MNPYRKLLLSIIFFGIVTIAALSTVGCENINLISEDRDVIVCMEEEFNETIINRNVEDLYRYCLSIHKPDSMDLQPSIGQEIAMRFLARSAHKDIYVQYKIGTDHKYYWEIRDKQRSRLVIPVHSGSKDIFKMYRQIKTTLSAMGADPNIEVKMQES